VSYFLSKFNINTIYHAAAYKHVPMVEYNITEGVYNNFIGTAALVTTADGNVDTFVLVSTDKAVRPTNVMGATKRLSEMYVQAVQERRHRTKTTFSMVRFGNVLGSSGSVIPLFLEQIARGEPLTVTHPDITRYFMSIPEAAQLVIQAGAMATGGEVFVLDMGESVKIVDMAKRLLQHYNLPENHYEITGLRPGEKLYEELLIGDSVGNTYHPRIMKANEFHPSYSRMLDIYDIIEECYHSMDFKRLFNVLEHNVSGFNHSGEIKDHLYEHN
jgi:FlaA1/EpsC-like NDP-sugar epimerase